MQPVQEADSPTAGTIFHATKLPLTLWFAAIAIHLYGEERHLVGGTRPPSRGPIVIRANSWAAVRRALWVGGGLDQSRMA